MKQLLLLVLLMALFAGCTTTSQKQKAQNSTNNKPNILFLLADDLGYGEVGCYGQKTIKTPVLDSLASVGMRFTNFYAACPVCSPSRAAIMTGKGTAINTIRGNKGWDPEHERYDRIALQKTDTTLAEVLKTAGYQTAFVGKWHLDDPNDLSTWAYNRGYDYAVQEQWGSPYGGIQYDEQMHWINGKQDSIYYHVKNWNCKDEFRTQIAFDWLDTKLDRSKPFFLFMSYRAPHAHEPEIGNQTLYADRGWPEKERIHAAKVSLLDRQIGRMLNKLDKMGLLDNTLVLFSSDNGPHGEMGHDYEFFNSNGPLRGYKRDTYEGGIRVPTMAFWRGKIKAGQVSDYIGIGQDFLPTIAEAAGVRPPADCNGVSFLPVLLGQTTPKRDFVNWEFQKNGTNATAFRQACRIGNMKGVRYGINNPTELYDLSADISEKHNIAAQHPELVKRMEKIFKEERSENPHYPYGGGKLPKK